MVRFPIESSCFSFCEKVFETLSTYPKTGTFHFALLPELITLLQHAPIAYFEHFAIIDNLMALQLKGALNDPFNTN
jgi:hypothetical protein